ncbi:hypothetical protein CUN60_08110 [Aquella oligotrophica]|uniref:Uncharacterized protein n=2 Tax=Aquella oligotrophica TaxID=2067065 RepID=A0A2I7N729_9NEIS|nr:hypothetical protein CUN60_08110 [Aquella oligotrophica]
MLKRLKNLLNTKVRLRDLPYLQRFKIYRSLLLVNLLLIAIISVFSIKVHGMISTQKDLLDSQLFVESDAFQNVSSFKQKYDHHIDTSLFIITTHLIDVKAEVMPISFALTMTYPESWVSSEVPEIDLSNGDILSHDTQYRNVVNGIVEEIVIYQAELYPSYNSILYPLDNQLVYLNLSMKKANESGSNLAYLEINKLHYYDQTKHRNYHLIESGIHNQVQQYNVEIGKQTKQFYDLFNVAYFKYSHKNIYSYLKIIQYIILSILIATFALLINPKVGTAISGRISVIGSSVFSLSANIFQVNTLIRAGSGITLIDIMTAFAGFMILLCFLITTRTIKLNDEFGHDASKVYDLIMFRVLIFYTVIFFIITYIQV